MNLFICTQTVNSHDPILGFFVPWIHGFAQQCDTVTVVCLNKGADRFAENVRIIVIPAKGKIARTLFLLRTSITHRKDYEAVLVHMNPEYFISAGFLWRFLRKRTALWYTHSTVDWKLRIATAFAQVVFTASKESFRLPSDKVCVTGHGIDTHFFHPDSAVVRGRTVLSVGRLSPVKRHDLVIRAAACDALDVKTIGDGTEHDRLARLAEELQVAHRITFCGSETQEVLRREYQQARALVHTSETGSLDKVVLEALACGLPVVTTSTILSDLPVVVVAPTPEAIAESLRSLTGTGDAARAAYVQEHHSLERLVPQLVAKLETL
ncbi:hypothetical protein COU19_00555 [Candidatus Kaiserbacteria bacterium CG10_big_fil_rev_8_21_14_0_10_56_12]|uniref:Glycosyl transferase family 1 domain-containing protein n=1 Tax=Candidatus Kaiserbacteria bacterium CG10_big_fil_rev_8_21_14_0_10_56_12 TaxID=1974611 RepID=A0A2H0UAJ7_9BACT|nr:MAG: hypothetical protein COU19_00555 [Candidatus Kaiserbacteria bacterium CG10_big_fil_rev_8_21_14_0_10_56_12]